MIRFTDGNIEQDSSFIKRILGNGEQRDNFVKNFEVEINKLTGCSSEVIGALCCDIDIRKKIIESLYLVLPKISNKSKMIEYLDKQEVLDNLELFFDNIEENEVVPFFRYLMDWEIYDLKGILDLLSRKIQKVYELSGIYGIYSILNNVLTKFKEPDKFLEYTNIKEIDEFLANNFQIILDNNTCNTYDFKCFMGMKKFKQKIKKEGICFFTKFPLEYNITIKECEDIANDIFEKFTTEYFAIMKFGQNDFQKAKVFQLIMEELLEHSGKDKNSIQNIVEYGRGAYSKVYRVGDYVLKVGNHRIKEVIPNHRRILQPIIRTRILTDHKNSKGTNSSVDFIEVQNLVEKNWFEGMHLNKVKDILFDIYVELRDDGLIWTDIKPENVGRLLKKNSSNIYCDDFEVIDGIVKIKEKEKGVGREIAPHPNAIGTYGEINSPPLVEGNYVILDTDCVEIYNGESLDDRGGAILYAFEKRYQRLKREKTGIEK